VDRELRHELASLQQQVSALINGSLGGDIVCMRDTGAAPDTGEASTDNETIGSEWRGWGVRMGVVSMMAASGMALAGQAAHATTTVTEAPTTQANGDGEGLPLDLLRLPEGNSGATCPTINVDLSGDGGLPQVALLSDRALKQDVALVHWSR
jgi:hypothetical protein